MTRELTSRLVILRPDEDRAFQLIEDLDAAAVISYESAASWGEPPKDGFLARRDVASRLGGQLGAGPPYLRATARHASWQDPRHHSLAQQLVAYLRAACGDAALEGVEAGTVEFPLDETFGGGAYRIEKHLQGQGAQRLFLGRRSHDGNQLLIAFDWMSTVDVRAFKRRIAYESPGILPLEFVGKLDFTARGNLSEQSAAWGLVERATDGSWLPSLLGTFEPEVVFEQESRVLPSHDPTHALPDAVSMGRSVGKILTTAAAQGVLLTRVRPEYMWARRINGVLEITGLSARADEFFAQARTDAVSWPVFDRYYYAPEALHHDCDDRALVFPLAIMIAEWATGRFPYERKYHDSGPLSGEHLRLAVPKPLARLLSRGMRLDRSARPGLDEFLAAL